MFIVCATGLIALAVVLYGLHVADAGPPALVGVVVSLVAGASVIAWARYLTTRKKTQAELTGGEQYRGLADEYRRLADLAITAQEHTDLKLGELSAQLDYVREQNDSLQKILKEVE
ncbi:MAG: hypothetical protein ABSF03_16935 [Streptosporangiaceae bacterium]|jgi:hypothetical protein